MCRASLQYGYVLQLKVSFKMGLFSDTKHTHPGVFILESPPPPRDYYTCMRLDARTYPWLCVWGVVCVCVCYYDNAMFSTSPTLNDIHFADTYHNQNYFNLGVSTLYHQN